MNTLSYGIQKPQNSDTGDIFFPALASNAQIQNDHTHDGLTSPPLASQSQSVLHANWSVAPIGGGVYFQLVAVPAGLSFDTCQVWFKLSTGQYVFPSVERVSSTTYNVFINDNTLDLTAYYR